MSRRISLSVADTSLSYLADIEMDDFETRATRQRMNALMGEIHGDSDED